MADLIAGIVGLISLVMIVFIILTIVKFKQKNKPEGMKFLKFTGISFALMIVLSFVFTLFENPDDLAKADKDGEKVTASIDKKDKEEQEAEQAKKEEEEKLAKAEEERKAKEAEQKAKEEAKLKEEQATKEKAVQEKPQVTESKQKEETKPVTTEVVIETDKKEDIKKTVEKIVSTDLKKTKINELSVNNYQANENQYIVLPHLKWEVKNGKKMTVEMLEMYSDHVAAKLAEEKGIQEITVFWEVPYHSEGQNIAKFNYLRKGDGMAKSDKWLAPLLQ